MGMTKEQRLSNLHAEALAEFDDIQTAQRDVRIQCLDDRRFCSIPGAQWEGPLGEQFENKPRFEFNRTALAVMRVINEYRNNRITVDFQPRDGSDDDELADACDGLYRADERASTADEAYDNAFDEGVQGGMGAWRLRSEYEDEDDDDNDKQRIRIEPIFDADSTVFFDLGAKRQDKADAKRCYVLTPYPRAAYEEEFNDDPSTWPKAIQRSEFDWCTPDVVWVAEHYRVEEKTELVRFFRGLVEDEEDLRLTQAELDAEPEMLDQLMATGFHEVRQKRVKVRRIHKYLMSGGGILEDCGVIPGRCIPIIPYYGKRWVVDGIERFQGHVRLAKDAQRLTNMLMSWLAEMAARFDVEKPILSPEQVAGHAQMWAEDNVAKFPYLLLNSQKDGEGNTIPGTAAPQGYTKAPNMPPAMAALMQLAEGALLDLLGNQQAAEEMQPNMSGKAVELIQTRLDMQVFIYMSNLAKSMKRSGEVWLSMMKDIAVEDSRPMKTLSAEGKAEQVVLNEPAYDAERGMEVVKNDISKANFEVDVDVGPSSSSKRAATVRSLTGLIQMTQDPEMSQVLTSMAIMNLEGEGLGDVRAYVRAGLVRKGVIKPSEEEREEMEAEAANRQPDPQTAYLLAEAENSQAKAAKNRADTILTIADADLRQAQTAKTIAETDGAKQAQFMDAAEAFSRAALPPME